MNRNSRERVASWAIVVSIACGILLVFFGASAIADSGVITASASSTPALDRILTVKFDSSATASDRRDARDAVNADFKQTLAAPGLQQVSIPAGESLDEAAIALRANSDVSFVETPGHWQAQDAPVLPNDPYFAQQWGLNNGGPDGDMIGCEIYGGPAVAPCPAGQRPLYGLANADINAPEAWAIADSGSEPVAVVDTGVAYQHTDLAANIFTNQAEANGTSSSDDDGNGLEDDIHGWDFIGDRAPSIDNPLTPGVDESIGQPNGVRLPPDNDPRDPDGHGTHVSSIIGAETNNNRGIAGVDPRAQILPLRAADETGLFTWAAIEDAMSYAIDSQHVRVINGSFGGSGSDAGLAAIIHNNPGVLFVFSAGNGGSDHIGDDHDLWSTNSQGQPVQKNHQYPCDIPDDNVICVAATDWNDKLSKFSDYGYDSVDIAAPGSAIFGAWPASTPWCSKNGVAFSPVPAGCSDNPADHVNDGLTGGIGDFQFRDGTSMAAPMVSGAAALIWGANPTLDASQIKTLLVENTDPLYSLYGKVGFGGRLDVAKAAAAAANPPPSGWPVTPPPPSTGPDTNTPDPGAGTTPTTDPTPVVTPPPSTTDTTAPAFSVVNPKSVKVGTLGKIRFRVHCHEACSVKVLARADVAGLRALKLSASVQADRTRTLYVQFHGKSLQTVRGLLDQGQAVRVYFSVIVTDKSGNNSVPRLFTVKLSR